MVLAALIAWTAALFPVAALITPALIIPALITPALARDVAGEFDFYVLALSWSPSYCEAEGTSANRDQCASDKRFRFIVHGLWPQYERGFPQFCPSRQPDRVPDRLVDTLIDITPSAGLIGHQWRKHGSCSGLSQRDYFALTRKAREAIRIPQDFKENENGDYRVTSPQEVETAFIAANPGLSERAIAVTCDRRRLREVRICLSRNLTFRDCPEVDRRACRQSVIVLPPAR